MATTDETTRSPRLAGEVIDYGGTLVLPEGARPSFALRRPDKKNPVHALEHAHIVAYGGHLWLVAGDGSMVVAFRLDPELCTELKVGMVPAAVIKLIEGKDAEKLPVIVQLDERRWRLVFPDRAIEFWAPAFADPPKYAEMGLFEAPRPFAVVSKLAFNAELMDRAQAALGDSSLLVYPGENEDRAIRLAPALEERQDDRRAAVMPIRTRDDEAPSER